ncbi:hypothetical protein [Streptomyces sp. Ac-502]|uniref:hypothetical protein n=1 Tax=Streptomyces sp. Ac-502 TaxID=3342801 RepID=UPI0038624D96
MTYETGLTATISRVLVRAADEPDGRPRCTYVHLCGRLPERQKVTLGGLDHYEWVAPGALPEFFGPSAPLVEAALKSLANGTAIDMCDGVIVAEERAV